MIIYPCWWQITCAFYFVLLFKVSLSSSSSSLTGSERSQFVETFTDYKKNHIEDEINYTYHYYIEHTPSNVHVNHREERRGQRVNGQYGLLEPDGHVRNVYYEVDGGKGFRTVVQTRTANSRTHQLLVLGRRRPQAPVWHANPVAFVI